MEARSVRWEVFTDGACDPNPGKGGWGFFARNGVRTIKRSGFCASTTNNRMEYQAAIEALKDLPRECEIVIKSDSQLLVKTMNEWAMKWIAREILHKKKNSDLVRELLELSSERKVSWIWVKGHAGNYGNEMADLLAQRAAQDQKSTFIKS